MAQPDGTVEEFLGQDELQKAIRDNIHRKRFHLAELAPLCSDPILRGTFGYNAVCQTSHEILEGTYAFPLNFDKTTREILQECAAIQLQIPKSLVNTRILKEDWGKNFILSLRTAFWALQSGCPITLHITSPSPNCYIDGEAGYYL